MKKFLFYKCKVKSTTFSKVPLIKVGLFGEEFYCKPFILKDIKFPKVDDEVLVFSLDPPFNSRLFYIPLDLEDDSEDFDISNLESIFSKATTILNSFKNGKVDVISNINSYAILNSEGDIFLIANEDGSKIFITKDKELILVSKDNSYVKITDSKIDILKDKSFINLKNDKIIIQKDQKQLVEVKDDSIFLGNSTYFIKIKNDGIFLGGSSVKLSIDDSGITITNGGLTYELIQHNHISGAPGSPTSTAQPTGSPPNEQASNFDTIPNNYNV